MRTNHLEPSPVSAHDEPRTLQESTNRNLSIKFRNVKATLFLLPLLALDRATACVGCRQPAVDAIDEPQTILAGDAFSWSVLLLLCVVLAVVSFLAVYIAKTCQRLDRSRALS